MSSASEGSRLGKLLALLETGNSLDIRKAAAEQVASIAQAHPAQLPSLLRHIRRCLRNKQWDTRIAASVCLGLMAAHFTHHSVITLAEQAEQNPTVVKIKPEPTEGAMTFQTFDICQVLQQGTVLVASGGQEYEMIVEEGTRAEQLAKQQRNLKQRLGLKGKMEDLMDTSELISDADILPSIPSAAKPAGKGAPELLSSMSGLSSRERNLLKRKSRALQRSGSSQGSSKRSKSGNEATDAAVEQAEAEEDGQEWQAVAAGQWPFQAICDQMCIDMLDPVWEVRHGAALALREVLRSQADAAGLVAPVAAHPTGWAAAGEEGRLELQGVTPQDVDAALHSNTRWLEDCSIRLLCVLALDRFGDFTSDQVVAPVRETAAQALGAAVQPLPLSQAQALLSLLHQLIQQQQWDVRHGGLLGLKYLLAARKDASQELMSQALPAAILGLQDNSDDVRAVAAEALLPLAHSLAADPPQALQHILWDILLEVEELSPSTGSVLHLLTVVFAGSEARSSPALEQLMPRLWPLFRHPLPRVRLAVVHCLQAFLTSHPQAQAWLTTPVLQAAFRLLFQNLLMEADPAVLSSSQDTWTALLDAAGLPAFTTSASPQLAGMLFELACIPTGHILPPNKLLKFPMPASSEGLLPNGSESGAEKHVLGGEEASDVARMRLAAGQALGQLACKFAVSGVDGNPIADSLVHHLQRHSATSRIISALTVTSWLHASEQLQSPPHANSASPQAASTALSVPSDVVQALFGALAAPAVLVSAEGAIQPYAELTVMYSAMQQHAQVVVQQCHAAGVDLRGAGLQPGIHLVAAHLNADQAVALLGLVPQAPARPSLAAARQALALSAAQASSHEAMYYCTVTACLAAATVHVAQLPAKLNQVIQPLMAALRKEPHQPFQRVAAQALAKLMLLCIARQPCPNDRVIKNACALVHQENGSMTPEGSADVSGPVHSPAAKGATAFLQSLAHQFGGGLFTSLPVVQKLMLQPLLMAHTPGPSPTAPALLDAKQATETMQILKILGPVVDKSLLPEMLQAVPAVVHCCGHAQAAVKYMAVRCGVELGAAHGHLMLPPLLRTLVPLLDAASPPAARQGAVSMVGSLVQQLGTSLVPYLLLLVVPLMGRMSDPDPAVRQLATATFAPVVALLPLAQGMDPPAELDEQQQAAWLKDKQFLHQLMDNTKVDDFDLSVRLACKLRPYQREGIGWLAFLRRTGLHGCLADDMGLGKTLQATAIIAAAIVDQQAAGLRPPPTLIVCPPTLVSHWAHEIGKFVEEGLLQALQYQGSPRERLLLQPLLSQHNVVVASYESVKADVHWLAQHTWLYCVLDEGHIIRNPKSKITQACKALVAQHRLILTGTPIQNNVLELWSLFDFLMPGFLGTQARFTALYGKALTTARTSRKDSKEAQAGLLAMEGLHKQVKPFILRRTKDRVLADLPPKILQDVYVDASPLQRLLYQDFDRSEASHEVQGVVKAEAPPDAVAEKTPHVFQALQYLSKLCSHPLLVLDPASPMHVEAVEKATQLPASSPAAWKSVQPNLHQLHHAPKLEQLKQLLQECGIGWQSSEDSPGSAGSPDMALGGTGAGHRVLVFAQLKGMLDLVEADVLRPAGVSFLRLDGSVEAKKRFSLVQRFNSDPTIEVLLLTTHVGGLGLNLTSADIVIFLEHDWNPMKDLQAMDRAHRLGQRRTVNVYRLLTRDSLEEKIMGLQRFKLDVANSVVNQDNVSLKTMDAGRLLDLFTLDKEGKADAATGKNPASGKPGGLKSVLEGLEDLWDENQYSEEFSLQSFTQKLSSKK
ncbi:TPA: hypothetical protein ACH3X2_001776 [Trebouxia sp. C0005]